MLPLPAIAASTREATLRFVPESNLAVLDPVATASTSTQDHGVAVYDLLYGVDSRFSPKPQMAEGHTVSDDGRTWEFRLRDGLTFHDGEKVRGADCAASLKRWARRDAFGQALGAAVDTWEAPDDRTVRIRLKRPFPRLLEAIARPSQVGAFIMPERIAKTDPFTAITDMTGSGPFRFVPGEFVSGSRVVYERFDGYQPRQEPADYTAGGKVAHFQRVEWQVIPDVATATAALQSGEVDWLEFADSDVLPLLARNGNVRLQTQDPAGRVAFIRFNVRVAPFDNPAIRRAVLQAVTQSDFMEAINGTDPTLWRTCYSMFPCGMQFVGEDGASMTPPRDLALLREQIRQAGYAGERVVVLSASDIQSIKVHADITADLLKRLGMNVDLQVMDWGSVAQRRTSKEPIDKGGWSLFLTNWPAMQIANPATNALIRGLGDAGWFGWYQDDAMEQVVASYVAATTESELQQDYDAVQRRAFDQAPAVPLGQYFRKTAFRRDITGILPAWVSLPWNVRRA